ncbi:hypothetical protein MUK42_01061 [Musa troglodytarum]|uniref:protein-serine/threonine phosphatase n=1 Tax=Musa troglodytarum TaxID=320322 RepID=A0A9E7FDP6_9LILI|nr:hypothetical protein MUK42_01061 [Musa troglodytarum]
MCVKDEIGEASEETERLLSCDAAVGKGSSFVNCPTNRSENTVTIDDVNLVTDFVPIIRCGECSDIGNRSYMEDTHICISDLAEKFGCPSLEGETISFYGVFDGHGGKDAAHFVRDNLPRIIVDDSDFPLELEKVIIRSYLETDLQFAKTCHPQLIPSSGTTALSAMILGRSLLVANAGDCRAVLSQRGVAIEMSKDHKPSCANERKRIESLGGFIVDDAYLNGELGVTRALGDWGFEGLKDIDQPDGPLIAEPELKKIMLTKEDEFLLIGSDGIWDVFSNQNAVDFARRQLQQHNDATACCKELVQAAKNRGAMDNLTIVMVCFHVDPPPARTMQRRRHTISTKGFHTLSDLLKEKVVSPTSLE